MGDAQITEGATRVRISLESINNDFYEINFKKLYYYIVFYGFMYMV